MEGIETAGKSGCSRLLIGLTLVLVGAAAALRWPLPGAALAVLGLASAAAGMWRMQRVEAAMREAASRPFHIGDVRRFEDLLRLSPEQFESAMAHLFRARGYQVMRPAGAALGGDDVHLVLRNASGGVELAQVVHPPHTLASEDVRLFSASVCRRGASKGWMVTSGSFTGLAQKAAETLPVELVNGAMLRTYWRETFNAPLSEPEAEEPTQPYSDVDLEPYPFEES
jgi:hypothetical protein